MTGCSGEEAAGLDSLAGGVVVQPEEQVRAADMHRESNGPFMKDTLVYYGKGSQIMANRGNEAYFFSAT